MDGAGGGGAGRGSRARAGARTSLLDVLRDQFPNATTDDLVYALGLGSYVTATRYLESKYPKPVAVRVTEPIATSLDTGAAAASQPGSVETSQPMPLSSVLSRTRKRHVAVTAGSARSDIASELRKEFPSATQSDMIRAISLGTPALARELLRSIYAGGPAAPVAVETETGAGSAAAPVSAVREGGATPVPSSPTLPAAPRTPSSMQQRPATPQSHRPLIAASQPAKTNEEPRPTDASGTSVDHLERSSQVTVPHRTRRSTTIRLVKVPVMMMPSSTGAQRDERRAAAGVPSPSAAGEGAPLPHAQHDTSSSRPGTPSPPPLPPSSDQRDDASREEELVTKTIVVLDPVTEELEQDALLCGISRGPFLLVAMLIAFCVIGGSITGLVLSATIVSFPHRQECVACLSGQTLPTAAVWNYSSNLCVAASSSSAACDASMSYCLDEVLFCGAPECRTEQITPGVRLTPYWAVCLVSLISVTIATAYNIIHRFYLRPWFELITSWWSHSWFMSIVCCGCACCGGGSNPLDPDPGVTEEGDPRGGATEQVTLLLPPSVVPLEKVSPEVTRSAEHGVAAGDHHDGDDDSSAPIQLREPICTSSHAVFAGEESSVSGIKAPAAHVSESGGDAAGKQQLPPHDGKRQMHHQHDDKDHDKDHDGGYFDDDDEDEMSDTMSSIMNLSFLNGLTDDRDINDLDLLFSFFGTEAAFFLFILLLTNAYFVYLCVTVGDPSREATSAGASVPTTADSWQRYQSLYVTWLSSGTIAIVLITACNFPAYWYARRLLYAEGAYFDPVHLQFLEGKVRSIVVPRVKYLGTEWLLPVLTSVMLAFWTPIIPIMVTHTIPAMFVFFPITLAVGLVWALIYWVVIRPSSKNKLVWAASLGFLRLAGTFTCICYVQTMTNYMVLFYRGDSWHSVFAQEAAYRSGYCYSNGMVNSVSNSVIFLLRNLLS